MNNAVLKTMEGVRNHRDIKLITTKARRNYLVSEPNYHTTKFFRKFISNKNQKKSILIKRSVYLGLSILEMSKTVIYKFWNDYVNSKYGEKAKLCYMDKTAL